MGAAFVRDGDVLPRLKLFLCEMVSSLIVMVAGNVITKRPVAAGAMNEVAKIVGLSGSKPCDAAGFAVLPPHFLIEQAIGIQRTDENVSHPGIAKGVLGLPREF